jgi:hypothetical protein
MIKNKELISSIAQTINFKFLFVFSLFSTLSRRQVWLYKGL